MIRNSPDNKGEENILSLYIDSEHENKKNVKIFPSTYHARPTIQTPYKLFLSLLISELGNDY